MTLNVDSVLNLIILLYGIYTLLGVTLKPDFYWESKRVKIRRDRVGDQTTARMYLILGVIMIAVALWALFIRG